MTIKLISIIKGIHQLKRCTVCNEPFTDCNKLISKGTSRSGKVVHYHIHCARKVNLLTTDIWWNHTSKYTRFNTLSSMDSLEPDEIEDYSQSSYAKLPEEIKLLVDIYFLGSRK